MLANVTALINHSGKAREAAQAAAEDRKRRAAFSFSEGTGSRYVWLRDPDEEFIVAKVVEERPDDTVAVEIGTARQSKVVRKQDVAFPIFRPSTLRTNFDDMVKMEDVNDATILHNLRQRFMEDQIYTNIGEQRLAQHPAGGAAPAARTGVALRTCKCPLLPARRVRRGQPPPVRPGPGPPSLYTLRCRWGAPLPPRPFLCSCGSLTSASASAVTC